MKHEITKWVIMSLIIKTFCYIEKVEISYIAVLETAGVPVTGGPPMLMSNAVYFSWRSIYGLNNSRLL